MFIPNHWHQTVVCYQATCVQYPNKQRSNQRRGPVICHMKLMTRLIHRLKKTLSMTVSSSQKLWNAMLEFLHYGIDRKMGVTLRCILAMHIK